MKNRLDDRPDMQLRGRTVFSRDFVAKVDLDGRDVLDLGCGFGWFTHWALRQGARSVVGVEPQEDDLATVRRFIVDPRATFGIGSAVEIPIPAATIDTVVMWEVLEHIPKGTELRAFREIGRVLRPGGTLYLSTPNSALRARATDPAWWLIGHRHYSHTRLREFAEAAHLVVDAIAAKGGYWEIVHLNDMYASKWILRRKPLFERSLLRRLDREWALPGGFTNLFLRCHKAPRLTVPNPSEPYPVGG